MKTEFSVEGTVKAEFLLCGRPCSGNCGEPCPNENREIRLLGPVCFHLAGWRTLVIAPGFTFDGASIPRFCWSSVGHPLEHRFLYAALLHDALYCTHYLPRKTADDLFYDFLRDFSGTGAVTARKIHTAVRLFGGIAWRNKTEDGIRRARELITLKEQEND